MVVEWSTVVELEHPWYRGVRLYTILMVQSTTASHNNDISIIWRISFESFTRGGGERHRGHRSVICAGDVDDAVEWRQIKLKTSCDVPAALNQRRTTISDQRSTRADFRSHVGLVTLIKTFPKNAPGTIIK